MGNKVGPICNLLQPRIENLSCTDEHVLLDYLQQSRDSVSDVIDGHCVFDTGIATNSQSLLLGDVIRANLKAQGNTLAYKVSARNK